MLRRAEDCFDIALQACDGPKKVPEDKMETATELFEREDVTTGKVVLAEGQACNRLYIVRGGAVQATTAGETVPLREAGGFTFFGDHAVLVIISLLSCITL